MTPFFEPYVRTLQKSPFICCLWKDLDFLYTLFLFTASDIKTTLVPSLTFALVQYKTLSTQDGRAPTLFGEAELSRALIKTSVWIWLHLLAFNIENQRRSSAIAEDAINKPWRPLVCGRIAESRAHFLATNLHIFNTCFSLLHGSLAQSIAMTILGYFYNALGGADTNPFMRNILNAGGFVGFISGAARMFLNASTGQDLSASCNTWLVIIGLAVLTTVHIQDLADQHGDAHRGRRTVPLVFGDWTARCTIAVAIVFCSFLCVGFWKVGFGAAIAFISLGLVLAGRVLSFRNVPADDTSFKLWNVWILHMYMLPLLA